MKLEQKIVLFPMDRTSCREVVEMAGLEGWRIIQITSAPPDSLAALMERYPPDTGETVGSSIKSAMNAFDSGASNQTEKPG